MHRLEHDGASLAWTEVGHGPPLLCMHGGLSDSESDFGRVIPRLSGQYRVVAMDSRGHGRSSWGQTALSYAALAEDAAALLRHLDAPPAIVIGISDGGIAGLHLARRHPELVARLIAIGASVDSSGDTPFGGPAVREYSADQFAVAQPARLARWQAISPDPGLVLPFIDELLSRVWRPPVYMSAAEVAGIEVPTVIVQGDADEYVTVEHARWLHQTIPGSSLAVIPECGHMIFESNPAAAWKALTPFLHRADS